MANALRQSVPRTGLLAPQPTAYLQPPDPMPTGDPYVDKGTVCDRKNQDPELWRHHIDEYCYMAPGQRSRQVGKFQGRVTRAATAYAQAITRAEVRELVASTSGGSWAFELLLDAIGLALLPSIGKAFVKLYSAGKAELIRMEIEDAGAAMQALRSTQQSQIEGIARQAMTTGKKAVPRPSSLASQERDAKLRYLDTVASQAELAFQSMSEEMVAELTDVDLLILTEAYATENGHSKAAYAEHIDGLLEHFVSSGVGKIGIHWNERKTPDRPIERLEAETRAFWVNMHGGRKLALYRRGHLRGTEPGEPAFGYLGGHRLSTEDAAENKKHDLEKHPLEFDHFVPDDLVDVAVRLHIEAWGEEPEVRSDGLPEWVGGAGGGQ